MNDNKFSDEFLNAFVDDQLAAEEKARAYLVINSDKALNQRVCELRKIRDLVQLAYKNPPAMETRTVPRQHRHRRALIAGVMLSLGIALGWALRDNDLQSHKSQAVTHARAPKVAAPAPAPGKSVTALQSAQRPGEVKIVLHLNRGNTEHMREVLDEAENVLQFYRDANQLARVEIITNGEGLNLLRADKTPYLERISALQKQYNNLVFAACQNTIDRLKREQGIQAQLVPEAIVIDSGVAQIILLQQQGWAYIQV